MHWGLGIIGFVLLLVAGCSEARLGIHAAKLVINNEEEQASGYYKVGNPYKINGKWYYPRVQPDYQEVGMSSWYGPTFHGKRTANGETFDRYAMTAAHRTLPMPSLVRVTNLENDRAVTLRVNDRGPFVGDRIIDVSEAAATALGFRTGGLARVRVEVITLEEGQKMPAVAKPAPAPQPNTFVAAPVHTTVEEKASVVAAPVEGVSAALLDAPQADNPANRGPRIQVGSFQDETNARELAALIMPHGPVTVTPVTVHERPYWRVRLGPYETRRHALQALDGLRRDGYAQAQIIASNENR